MKRNSLKRNTLQYWIQILSLVFLAGFYSSCQKSAENTTIPEIDKKYLSESQLFALNKAIENDPDDADNFYKRAKIYLERNEKKKALNDINRAIHFKNTEGNYHYLKAQIFHEMNLTDSSLYAAETAQGMNVKDAELKVLLSLLYLQSGNMEQAGKYLDQVVALTPHHPEVSFLQGKFAAVKGDTTGAIRNFYQTLQKDTNNAEAYEELSAIYYKKHQYDSSLIFTAAGKMADPEDPFFFYQEGLVFEKLHLPGSAKANFHNSVRLDSTFAPAYLALANVAYSEGREAEAVRYYERDLRFNPDDIPTNLRLAAIYQKQDKAPLAIPLLERVVKMDTSNKTAKADLEKLYQLYPAWDKPGKLRRDSIAKAKADSAANAARETTKPQQPAQPVQPSQPSQAPASPQAPQSTQTPQTKTPPVVKPDTAKKKTTAPAQKGTGEPPKTNKKAANGNETSKENRNFIPIIKNPDSTKIEVRPDSNK